MGCKVFEHKVTAKDVIIDLHDSIGDYEDFDDLFDVLDRMGKNDSLTVRLNTPGGRCDVGFEIIHRLVACPCPIHMVVEYPTCSMGAILALCGDKLTFAPDTYIMFHDYSGGSYGKGEETIQYSTNFRKVFKSKFEKLCKPFLTQAECDTMFKGEDLYIHDDDKSLKTRMKRHFK